MTWLTFEWACVILLWALQIGGIFWGFHEIYKGINAVALLHPELETPLSTAAGGAYILLVAWCLNYKTR